MNNIITKLQTCIFMNQTSIKYIDDIAPKIIDPDKIRKLYCDFEAININAARKLCATLIKLGFDVYSEDYDEKYIHAEKDISFNNVKYALNLAMYEAYRYSSELVCLMVEQDITPNNKLGNQQ